MGQLNFEKPILIELQSIKKSISADVPSSKSHSHRAMILSFIASNSLEKIQNLSTARDTQLLINAIQQLSNSEESTFEFKDAGTPARLFISLCAALNKPVTITGNKSLENRSMKPLIDVLISSGAEILYKKNEGFIPLEIIKGITKFDSITIDRTISSQYVTSLMLIAPLFDGIKTIQLTGDSHSDEYIEMTKSVLTDFGIQCKIENQNKITIGAEKPKLPENYTIESDWSSAGYLIALASVMEGVTVEINSLSSNSCQGDAKSLAIWQQLGIAFEETNGMMRFSRSQSPIPKKSTWDLSQFPDMAPTLIIAAALNQIECSIQGIENLKYKECDRIAALRQILNLIGYSLTGELNHYQLTRTGTISSEPIWEIKTQNDHRMAMVGALLSIKNPVIIDHPNCVEKSFPQLWELWQKCNFELSNYGAQ